MIPFPRFDRRALLVALVAGGFCSPVVHAQNFPDKPITIIVPFAPGSRTDQVARAVGDELGRLLKQPVIVDNKSGANQVVGDAYVARARPDGYTLLMVTLPSVTAPSIQKTLPFASLTDFAPVATLVKGTGMLVVGADVPASNLKEFVTLLKANPGKYSYGSGGMGSPMHLVIEQFSSDSGTSSINVPYKSVASVLQEILAGHVTYGYVTMGAMEFVRSGKLKVLGVTGMKRNPAYPDIPTLNEAGLKGFEYAATYALVAPKGTPAAVIERLNSAANMALGSPGFNARMKPSDGVEVSAPMTPAQTGALIANEEAHWNTLVKTRNIQLE